MALTNFTLPFGALTQPVQAWGHGATLSPLHAAGHQLAASTNNLLYSPADHQQQDDGAAPPPGSSYYKNNPYAPPQLHQQQQESQPPLQQSHQYQYSGGRKNTYLPPIPPPGTRNTAPQYHQPPPQTPPQQQFSQHFNAQPQIAGNNNNAYKPATRTYGENTYSRFPTAGPQVSPQAQQQQQPQQQQQYYKGYSATQLRSSAASASTTTTTSFGSQQQQQQQQPPQKQFQTQQSFGAQLESASAIAQGNAATTTADGSAPYPERPPGFTRVQAGQGSRTQVHAVLDYDAEEGEEDYYDEGAEQGGSKDGSSKKSSPMPTVTPIQGPIFLKNGTVPVVPLFSYPTINNGSFVQIPIWWTALSVALGLDVRGDIIKGVPCIKRYHQLFCPTAGNSYPIDKIERFIDDNKALMRRMYGDFEMNMDPGGPRQQAKRRKRRFIDEPDIFIPPGAYPAVIGDGDGAAAHVEAGDSYFGKLRQKRQSNQNRNQNKGGGNTQNGPGGPGSNAGSNTGRLDACESKIEIVTPYWASNSAGKIRAIVNTQHFEQAIHQEICSKSQTPRCERDCGCEQKYKWHRLLAYDPDNDCKGIFMDWFLFPSCCVCRCNP